VHASRATLWDDHLGIKEHQDLEQGWLAKLRSDQRREKAELAVLVSVVLPKEVRHFGHLDGIWVTEFSLALAVGEALRAQLIQAAALKQSSKGKLEKVELVYEYLQSTEFKHRREAIVEAFRTMKEDLDKERQTVERQWNTLAPDRRDWSSFFLSAILIREIIRRRYWIWDNR
jgi:hypothetical protein